MNEYNHTGHPSISTSEYKEVKSDLKTILRPYRTKYVKQHPYVGG